MKIPLNLLFEKMFGLKDVTSKEQVQAIIDELRKNPDKIIDLNEFDDSEKK